MAKCLAEIVEAIDFIYPTKLTVIEKRMPAFERVQAALMDAGHFWPVPRQLVTALEPSGEPAPARPVYGAELFDCGLAQLISGYGGHGLLVGAGLAKQLEPMDALLDELAVRAVQMLSSQVKQASSEGREQLLEQLRAELFLKVSTAGPLDLLRTEEAINRCWRELFVHREAILRLRGDLVAGLNQTLRSTQVLQWHWRVSLVNGRLRARQITYEAHNHH